MMTKAVTEAAAAAVSASAVASIFAVPAIHFLGDGHAIFAQMCPRLQSLCEPHVFPFSVAFVALATAAASAYSMCWPSLMWLDMRSPCWDQCAFFSQSFDFVPNCDSTDLNGVSGWLWMPSACPISWRRVTLTSVGNADGSMMMLHLCC